jgi:competence protein ComEA
MDLIGEERGRLTRAAQWLQATRAELAGLAVLLTGCVAVTAVLWLTSATGPQGAHPGDAPTTGPVGAAVELDAWDAHLDEDGAWVGDDPKVGDGHGGPPGGDAEGPAMDLVVHVSGAVAEPGLVTVPEGGRVGDAIASAGGTIGEADVDRVNLAQPLTDGERIHVPREGEEDPPPTPSAGAPGGGGRAQGPVDLNRAGAEELETLPGIGPARAQAIVEHREAHGPFAEPGDLRAVSGIGEATFQRLADLVSVS